MPAHCLLEPFGDFRAVEAELAADFLAGDLPPLGHPLDAAHIAAKQLRHFLNGHGPVRHLYILPIGGEDFNP